MCLKMKKEHQTHTKIVRNIRKDMNFDFFKKTILLQLSPG